MKRSGLAMRISEKRSGFTLPEVLVVVVIIGLVGAIGIPAFFFLVRRARVNSVALEVAGWIEQARNAAADEVDLGTNNEGCAVQFEGDGTLSAGDPIALADCDMLEPQLSVPLTIDEDVAFEVIGPREIIFTPRGLWTNAGNQTGLDLEIQLRLDGGFPLRCVRLSPTLGSVTIGRPNNFAGNACQNYQTL